jgi:aryl carrier-like protein
VTATERLLAEIWQDVFGEAAIGRDDNFFDRGGDSLRAMVVAARVHAALGVTLELRRFAERPTLATLASAIDAQHREDELPSSPELVPVARTEPLPLSFAQERTWQFSQTPEASTGYTVACCHLFRGPLDVLALRAAMTAIARRHEILRTTFATANGAPVQVIHPPGPVAVPLIDLTGTADPEAEATTFFRRQAGVPFDLTRLPLLRFHLLRVRPDEHWLLRVNHHIISDNWSWFIYFRELGLLYDAHRRGVAPPVSEVAPLQYADYAAWQRRVLDPRGPGYRAEVAWWAELLKDPPEPLELPFRRRRSNPGAPAATGVIRYEIDPGTTGRLEQFTRATDVTYYVVRLAAFAAVLALTTGQRETVLGTYVSNRRRMELQALFGYFANLAALRLQCRPHRSFRQWVADVRAAVGDIQARSEIPYEQLGEELRRQGVNVPEIRAIFGVSDRSAVTRLGSAELTWLDRRTENMPWGFTFMLDHFEGRESCRVTFDARLYDPPRVHDLVARFGRYLAAAAAAPDMPLNQLGGAARKAAA